MQGVLDWWSSELRADLAWATIRALAVLILGWQVARFARFSLEQSAARTATDASLRILLGRIAYLVIVSLAILTALDLYGVPLSSVVTTLGIVGIAISLALQDLLKNFFAGLYLLVERPFRIGDEIQLKDFVGRVEHVSYRTTVILTTEGVRVLIPNATLISEVVLNRGTRGGASSEVATGVSGGEGSARP